MPELSDAKLNEGAPKWEKLSKEEFIETLKFLKPGDEYPFDRVWVEYVPQEGKPLPIIEPHIIGGRDFASILRDIRNTFEKRVRYSGSAYALQNGHSFFLPDELIDPISDTLHPDTMEQRELLCLMLGERGRVWMGKDRI
jgi:hypothetical protein